MKVRYVWNLGLACFPLVLPMMFPLNAKGTDEFRLGGVFGDHMIVQREQPWTVWGHAQPGEQVAISFAGLTQQANANSAGRWRVELPGLPAGGPHELNVRAGGDARAVTFQDILVGDVWLCAGQSNMDFALWQLPEEESRREVSAAQDSRIRVFKVENTASLSPREDLAGRWSPCTPEHARNFTAIGYYLARELRSQADVPMGIIHCAWGATRIQSWISRGGLTQTGVDVSSTIAELDNRMNESGGDEPPDPDMHKHIATAIYNGMIHPLGGFNVRGIAWYQGESDALLDAPPILYRPMLVALIHDWRRMWNRSDLPFLIVQLPNYGRRSEEPPLSSHWAIVREAQMSAAREVPNAGLVVTIDCGDARAIHPPDKLTVARRLANCARKIAYHQDDAEHPSPMFRNATIEENKIRVTFESTGGGGLVARGALPYGFAVAADDRDFKWAHATIDGDSVLVWSNDIKHPIAVRYAWDDDPACNLYDKQGLPVAPFRTDDW